jgi:hypothetical protein
MANSYKSTTRLWYVDTAETLATKAPDLTTAWVRKVVMVPNAADDAITFQDSASANAIYLKAGATDASPVQIDFGDRCKRIEGLKCSSLSTSVVAYVYLR